MNEGSNGPPPKMICDRMGSPESQYDFVRAKSNSIRASGDPEYIPEGSDLSQAFMTAGAELAAMMSDVGAHKRRHPGDDLTSALVTAGSGSMSSSTASAASRACGSVCDTTTAPG